jgi:hypothetical protein
MLLFIDAISSDYARIVMLSEWRFGSCLEGNGRDGVWGWIVL